MLKKIIDWVKETIKPLESRSISVEGQPEELGDPEKLKREAAHRKFEESRQKHSAETAEKMDSQAAQNAVIARIKGEIRSSLQTKRLKFLYQPIFDINEKTPIFYEVFTHLLDKTGRTTDPEQYLPIAKISGLSSWLDEVVLSETLERQKESLGSFSIHLTQATLLKSMDFFEQLMVSTMETGFSTKRLLFEINFADIDDKGDTLLFIKEAKALQVGFILDYVGGGTKVINLVNKLGFDYIKVDGVRFADFANKPTLVEELKTIIDASKKSDISLIMTHVETKELYELCKEIGFDYIQGDYLAIPSEELNQTMQHA